MRRIRVLALLLALVTTAQLLGTRPVAAATVKRQAIITEILRTGTTARLKLDYVEIKECDCDGGFEIVNNNPLIRTFTTTSKTKIFLLRNSTQFFKATMIQLIDGRKGQDLGWYFDKATPFELTVDEAKKQIVEIRQMYFP
jgi:hypothetical protein